MAVALCRLKAQTEIQDELLSIRFTAKMVERLCDTLRSQVEEVRSLERAIADIAAAPDLATLFAALPCSNKIAKVDGITFADFAALPRASAPEDA